MISKQMRPFLGGLFILTFHFSYAQIDKKNVLTNDKNEIGINFGPLLMPFQDDHHYIPEFGVTFKRVVNRSAFRFNFTYRPLSYGGTSTGIAPHIPVDSTYSILRTTKTQRSFVGRIGYEYRIPCASAFYFTIGGDIRVDLVNHTRGLREDQYVLDSIANPGTAEPDYTFSSIQSKKLLFETSRQSLMGFELSGGVFFPVGKHFVVGGQLRNGIFYSTTKATTTDLVAENSSTSTYSEMQYDIDNMFSEILLLYRF